MDEKPLPPPLEGCLVCHTEGSVALEEGRSLPIVGTLMPTLNCDSCGSVAKFRWDGESVSRWAIRYQKILSEFPYTGANRRLLGKGWLSADDAISISSEIYIHRQRLQQIADHDLSWIKPSRLNPPPPLMTPDELIYLSLKPASYCETGNRRMAFMSDDGVVLDTGILYVTDSKIHLLGQRRDRSQRLSEITDLEFRDDQWFIHVDMDDQRHHYRGLGQGGILDAQIIVAIIGVLNESK